VIPSLAAVVLVAPALAGGATLAAELSTGDGGALEVSADLGPAFGPELERRLGNGLTNVVAVHLALAPAGRGAPAAIHARELQVLYDVWEETWGVVVREPGAPQGRTLTFATWRALRDFLSSARRVPLGPAEAVNAGAWVVQARVEVNPPSQELIERTRELIANPAAGPGAPSRSVLGAMASFLLREPPPGGQVRVLRSAPFTARDVKARRP
jgi:hypothetical protein